MSERSIGAFSLSSVSLTFESDNEGPPKPQNTEWESVVPYHVPGLKCTGQFFNINPYKPLMEQVDGPRFIKFMAHEQAEWCAEARIAKETRTNALYSGSTFTQAPFTERFKKEVRLCSPSQWKSPSYGQTHDVQNKETRLQVKHSTQNWGFTDTQGNRMDLAATDRIVDADCTFTSIAVEVISDDEQVLSPREKRKKEAKERKRLWREKQKEKKRIDDIGREIDEGYARQTKESAEKAAAEEAAKRATLPPKKIEPQRTFHLFKKLPAELRLQIWRGDLSQQRIARAYISTKVFARGRTVKVFKASTPPASILHVDHESRTMALKYMKPFLSTKYSGPCIYMIPHIDRLYVNLNREDDFIAFEKLISESERRRIQILQMPLRAWMYYNGGDFVRFIYNFKKLQFVVFECAEADDLDGNEELWTGFPNECAKVITHTFRLNSQKLFPDWKIPKAKIVKIEAGMRTPKVELMKKEWDGTRWIYWDSETQPQLKYPKYR